MLMDIEKKLTELFDFQRFENDTALQEIIDEVEGRYVEMSDDELEMLSAAGDPYTRLLDHDKGEEP